MPKGKKLSNEQIGRVKAYFEMGISKNCIAQLIGRSRKCVQTFFKTSNNNYKNESAGRPLKLTTKNERRLF